MDVDEKIKDCTAILSQIKRYDPDPYYVGYFLVQFAKAINQIYDGIFEEANRDFGLYVGRENSEKKFGEMALIKNDKKAVEFSEWFRTADQMEHKNTFPSVIREICEIKKKNHRMPELKIMLRPKERYKDDVFQEIRPRLSAGKLASKNELRIETSRHLPVFLELVNHKRKTRNEPGVPRDQIVSSACLMLDQRQDIEVSYAVEVYIPLIKRIIKESRKKIIELTAHD